MLWLRGVCVCVVGRSRGLPGRDTDVSGTRGPCWEEGIHLEPQGSHFSGPPLPRAPASPHPAHGWLSSPLSGTGIPGTRWQLLAAVLARTQLQAAVGAAKVWPGLGQAATESQGLGQPALPTLGTSGLRPGCQEIFPAAWVLCPKCPLLHPPLSPSPVHSCSCRQQARWVHRGIQMAGLRSSGQTSTQTPATLEDPDGGQHPGPRRCSSDHQSLRSHPSLSLPCCQAGLPSARRLQLQPCSVSAASSCVFWSGLHSCPSSGGPPPSWSHPLLASSSLSQQLHFIDLDSDNCPISCGCVEVATHCTSCP